MTALFISDLHLCQSRPAANRLFLDFLAGPARQVQALYILGDLFEYWAGDDDLDDPFNAAMCAGLLSISDAGVPVFFIAGNRDFLVGAAFARSAGLTLLTEPCVAGIGGIPTLLLHGDTLCADDAEYQSFRTQVRDTQWQREFMAQPLVERKRRIEELRGESEARKRVKPMEIMDANQDAVVDVLRQSGCTRLIHGHTHRPAHHKLIIDGRECERWVLPDWYESGGYLACDTGGCRPIRLSPA